MRSLSVLLLFSSVCAFAQEGHHGPRIGLGMATQSAGGLFQSTQDLLLAPVIGWYVEAPLHPQVSLMPELLWMTKGAVVRNQVQGVRARSTLRYIEVPLLLKVSLDASADGMYLLAGPSFGAFMTGRYQTWLNGEEQYDYRYTLAPNERRYQFSGVLGMGMEGPKMAFDVRAQTSLTPFDRFIRSQNVVYALTVAYRFSMEKKRPKAVEEE